MSWSPELRLMARRGAEPPIAADWSRLLAVAESERIAASVARRWNGAIPAPARQAFEGHARLTMARQLLLDRLADRLFGALAARGIRPIPLKGVALVRFVHPPGVRDMVDIDLLVRPEEVDAASATIRSLGFQPLMGGDSGGAFVNSIFFKSATDEFTHDVHLHWHVLNSSLPVGLALGRLPLDAIRARAKPIGDFALMDPHDLLLTLCEHALKHSFHEWMLLVDVAALLDGYRDRSIPYVEHFRTLDLDRAATEARRWGIGLAAYTTLRLIHDFVDESLVPAAVLSRLAREVRGLDGRWFVNAMLSGRRREGLSSFGYLAMTDGAAARLRFVASAVFPPDEAARAFGKRPGPGIYVGRLSNLFKALTGGGAA